MAPTDYSVRTIFLEPPSRIPQVEIPTTTREEDLNLVRHLCRLDLDKQITNDSNTAALRASIRKKVRGYERQDASKDRVVEDNVGCVEVARALAESKLMCRYCGERVTLGLGRIAREKDPRQWTLDRVENHIAHTETNVVVCCLKCNLIKRRRDTEKFALASRLANNGGVVKLDA